MAFDNEKKFALFKNDKGDNDKRPDYRGTVTINGVEYKLSGWIASKKDGEKYIRGSVEVKQDGKPAAQTQRTQQPPATTTHTILNDDTDSVPF